ncbi:hypothetical protein [Bradyrhizobium sp. HKCCYLR20261]|uniref:hypothetical protein n=1 Tax=unclassified Bradyrhizobium TaxID=2631580 RepID=UPI003EBE9E3B
MSDSACARSAGAAIARTAPMAAMPNSFVTVMNFSFDRLTSRRAPHIRRVSFLKGGRSSATQVSLERAT